MRIEEEKFKVVLWKNKKEEIQFLIISKISGEKYLITKEVNGEKESLELFEVDKERKSILTGLSLEESLNKDLLDINILYETVYRIYSVASRRVFIELCE